MQFLEFSDTKFAHKATTMFLIPANLFTNQTLLCLCAFFCCRCLNLFEISIWYRIYLFPNVTK